ncbi:MAG: hypothetical protein HPY66_1649 [Firmicutes bacterium]|nr:hypothetical protein [Bacillota bacterium]
MFDPENDLERIWDKVSNDAAVLAAMGLTGQPKLVIIKRIIKKSKYDDLANTERRLCIYFVPSRPALNNLVTPEMIEVDCHVPDAESMIAYRVIKAVKDALHEQMANGKQILFAGQLGELATASGYFCAGIRFKYYGTY